MYLRRRKLMQPLPPLPPSTRIMASSTNFIVLAYGTDSRVTHKKPGEIFDAMPAAARSVTAKDGAAQKSPVSGALLRLDAGGQARTLSRWRLPAGARVRNGKGRRVAVRE